MSGADADPRPLRGVRSFVLRQGRLTHGQQRAHETLRARYGIAYTQRLLDFAQTFGRDAPTVLEIGFGMGETTAAIAQTQPEHNFIAIEVHTPGVGSLLKRVHDAGLANVRVIQHDAVEVVRDMIAENTLAGIHVFFPDPWPKKRHHKRRLLQSGFVRQLARRLTSGGYLHVATDWEDYAQQILSVLRSELLLANTAADFAPRPRYRPLTKFEQRGLKLGHGVWDLLFVRAP